MSRRHDAPLVAHVILENFFQGRGGSSSLDSLLTKTALFESCLERHGRDWERPAADEAVLVSIWNRGPERPVQWAESLRDDIGRALEAEASVGIATTRLAARIASRMARPRGVLVLLPGYEKEFISPVPLVELDELRSGQAAALRRRGVETLGQMAGLTDDEARSLLGPDARRLMRLVRGTAERQDRHRLSRLERAIRLLCQRAARKLDRLGAGARGLEVSLVYGDGVSLERYSLTPCPLVTDTDLESSARSVLRRFPEREQPVIGVSLTLTGLAVAPDQMDLFPHPRVRDVSVRLGRPSSLH